jgi:hypothetical protein
MKRLLGVVMLAGVGLAAQPTSMESTFLALKDAHAPRGALSTKLAMEITLLAVKGGRNQGLQPATVERFSEDLTTALLGKDITAIRAAALQKTIARVLSGKGSTFDPATSFREALVSCGVDDRTVQAIIGRIIDIGQEIRGPDDLGVLPKQRLK